MLKSLVKRGFRSIGYQLVPVAPMRVSHDDVPNPRFDQQDLDACLRIIEEIVTRPDSRMAWDRSQRYLDPRRANFYYAVLDLLESANVLTAHARVLDLGVYFGYMLRLLQRYHPDAEYHGTETNDTRLAVARELCPFAHIQHGTIDSLDAAQRFDLVLLTEVLEHLVNPVDALHKVVGIGRTVLLTVPDGRVDMTEAMQIHEEFGSYRGHVNFWSPESWRYMLERELPNRAIQIGTLPTRKMYALVQT